MASFISGLPSMLRFVEHDTALPRNIFDWEWNKSTQVLPESRPISDLTPIAFVKAKMAILQPVERIIDFVNSVKSYPYEDFVKLDDDLEATWQTIPTDLRTMTGNTSQLSQLMSLQFIYHHGMSVLHRKFLAHGRFEPQYALSRSRCVHSALTLLDIQNTIMNQVKSHGQLIARHWFHFPVTSHEFIRSAIVLCLELHHRRIGGQRTHNSMHQTQEPTYDDVRLESALKKSSAIWSQSQGLIGDDSLKVIAVLMNMMNILGLQDSGYGSSTSEERQITPSLVGMIGFAPENDPAMQFEWVSIAPNFSQRALTTRTG